MNSVTCEEETDKTEKEEFAREAWFAVLLGVNSEIVIMRVCA